MAARVSMTSEASSLKAKGNALYRDGKFVESLVEYTSAVELDRLNPILYSNRSLAFLKLGQHFYALKDAEMVIRLNPEWPKGYYRKGQVEEAAEQYEMAMKSYERGLRVNPHDEGLKKALSEVKIKDAELRRKRKNRTRKYIIFFAVASATALVVDMNMELEMFTNQILLWVMLFGAVIFGTFCSQVANAAHDSKMKMLLAPPKDLLKEIEKNGNDFDAFSQSRDESEAREAEGSESTTKKVD